MTPSRSVVIGADTHLDTIHLAALSDTGKPLMVAAGSGLVVSISSFGTRGHLHSVLYGISKARLDKMTADMAVDLRGIGRARYRCGRVW